jgi:hypothetical protein
MTPLGDIRIDHGPERTDGGNRRFEVASIATALVLLIVLVGGGLWLVLRRSDRGEDQARPRAPSTSRSAPREPAALGPAVVHRDVPPLDASDPFVRNLLKSLSSRPELAAWLATDDLIRNFVVSVDNIAEGASPARHLRRLAPSEPFRTETRGDVIIVDARSYRRYDGIADTVASLDARSLAETYSILKPRIQEAYRELGHPDGNFDVVLERAIVRLLETPPPPPAVVLREGGVTYRFERPELERLSPAQKQLIRMGPRNIAAVQDQLREIARALGIPDERLPSRHTEPDTGVS